MSSSWGLFQVHEEALTLSLPLDGSGGPSGVRVVSMLFGDFWNGLKGTVDQPFVYSRLAKMPQLDMREFLNYCYLLSQMC